MKAGKSVAIFIVDVLLDYYRFQGNSPVLGSNLHLGHTVRTLQNSCLSSRQDELLVSVRTLHALQLSF